MSARLSKIAHFSVGRMFVSNLLGHLFPLVGGYPLSRSFSPLSGRSSLARLIVALALPWCRTCFFAGPVCFLLESTLLFSCRFAPLLSAGLSSRPFPPVMVFSAKDAPLLRLSVLLLSFPLVLNGYLFVAFVLCLLRRCPPLNEQNLSYEEAGKN